MFLLIIGIILVGIVIYQIIAYTNPISEEEKNKRETRKEELKATKAITLQHFYGLPVAEGTLCNLFLCEDKIVFESKGATFNLSKDKIIDVSDKSEKEITKSYVSSIGGAVGGALLFGPLGAMIGGRTKEKVDKEERFYLIFTYKEKDENKYISFLVNRDRTGIYNFIADFQNNYNKKEFDL